MDNSRDVVAKAIGDTLASTRDLTKIPIPITPPLVWEELKHEVAEAVVDVNLAESVATASAQNNITALTQELTSLQVAEPKAYREGTSPAINAVDATVANVGPTEVTNHVHTASQRAKTILASMDGMWNEAKLAVIAAVVLILICALGVSHPLMVKAIGGNGDPSSLSAMVWAVIVSTAFALVIGAVNVTFFRQPTTRMAPWKSPLIAVAIFFLVARYIASAMNADFMLMQDLPSWVATTIRLLEAIGVGVALACVEFGAGRALGFFWMRYQQKSDRPRLEQVQREIDEWNALRSKWDQKIRNAQRATVPEDLHKTAALIVAETISNGLYPHREIMRQHDVHIAQPWTGSTIEHIDTKWLSTQIKACADARDELLRLAGMNPPPASTIPAIPLSPPEPPATSTSSTTH